MARICFASYEIHPTTWGGCGVLLYNAARVLLERGHEIIFVLDIPADYFERFVNVDRLALPNADRCRAYHVESLCKQWTRRPDEFINDIAWRACRWHEACRTVWERERPDVIEFFDYCGVGHYAMAAKVAGMCYQDTHLAIRAHNSVEVMDANEGTTGIDLSRYCIYALEHSALRLAETVLYPTRRYLDEAYRPFYEPWFGTVTESRPPLVDHPKLQPATPDADICLFYGRLFAFKGADIFVDAAVSYLSRPENPRLRFYLVGYDSPQSPLGTGTYGQYLRRKIPSHLQDQFVFTGHLSWQQMAELSPQLRFAVFPNHFESFCYAAHELYAAGVPLLMSDIPAFRDYFVNGQNAMFFDGTTRDLAIQMERLAGDESLRRKISGAPPVDEAPLGSFYDRPDHPSWMVSDLPAKLPSMLACVLADSDEGLPQTLTAIREANQQDLRVVVLRPATQSSEFPPLWWLGTLYSAFEEPGNRPLVPSEVTTADCLLILKNGDRPSEEYLRRSREILARQKQIAFVGAWKQIADAPETRVDTFPLDAMLEYAIFREMPLFSRCVMRTPAKRLLTDLFDSRTGSLGELQYLWKLDGEQQHGIIMPKIMIQLAQETTATPARDFPAVTNYLLLGSQPANRRKLLSICALLAARHSPQERQPMAESEAQLRTAKDQLAQAQTELARIWASNSWRIMSKYWRVRDGLKRLLRGREMEKK